MPELDYDPGLMYIDLELDYDEWPEWEMSGPEYEIESGEQAYCSYLPDEIEAMNPAGDVASYGPSDRPEYPAGFRDETDMGQEGYPVDQGSYYPHGYMDDPSMGVEGLDWRHPWTLIQGEWKDLRGVWARLLNLPGPAAMSHVAAAATASPSATQVGAERRKPSQPPPKKPQAPSHKKPPPPRGFKPAPPSASSADSSSSSDASSAPWPGRTPLGWGGI